jgi:hypothetical protein
MERCDDTVCTEGEKIEQCEDTDVCVQRVDRCCDVMILICVYRG